MDFLAVSVDIFQTLADIHPRVPAVWQGILGDRFEPELAQKAAALLGASLPEGFREAAVEFVPMREFFVRRMETVLKSLEISADPEEAADIFRAEHGRAELYPDARPCLERVSARMPVFIASDADTEMAGPVLEKLPHGPVFLSEELRAYKQDLRGRFFRQLLEETGVAPECLLHVGDSAADILGARRAGIPVCLLERNGPWLLPGAPEPDFRIRTLAELPGLLVNLRKN